MTQVNFLLVGVNVNFNRLGGQHLLLGDGGFVVALSYHRQHFLLACGYLGGNRGFARHQSVGYRRIYND